MLRYALSWLGLRLKQRYKSVVRNGTTFLDKTLPVENVELTFVEEPLGLRADQGYGYLQVDFGQRIGPSDRYEILRKLGWGLNVRRAYFSQECVLMNGDH
jgi:hypothetical protein